ncbi:MAG TPA: choice-of-anchor tandem repeat GloVer-containing protein [Rhizomicrobium sp.]|jgi:uncharacterized repeat protein (TIGR03803 family)|nr:choice-of-anchor tandem repeat GloVer-containing protein [Rhizomicrobium sp.]
MKAVSIVLFAGTFGCLFGHAVSAMDAVTYKEKALYAFCGQQNCADGADPSANLIDVNGTLYGTTYAGGDTGCGGGGCGTVFSIDLNTGTEKMLYSFCSQANCTDGALPEAGLINVNGTLYGTTYQGGIACSGRDFGCGAVFSLEPNTGAEKVLYSLLQSAELHGWRQPLRRSDRSEGQAIWHYSVRR